MSRTTAPARPFRITRGEVADYRTLTYATREARDAAAQRWADLDGEAVLTYVWQVQDPATYALNGGWGNDGQVHPTGTVLPADPYAGLERGPASLIRVGDTVTVFAHAVGRVGVSTGGRDWTGTVERVETVEYAWAPVIRATLRDADGKVWVRDAVDTAVTRWHGYHDARQCSCAEFGTDESGDYEHNCCIDCGRAIYDDGVNGWKHADTPPAQGPGVTELHDAEPAQGPTFAAGTHEFGNHGEVTVAAYVHHPSDGSAPYVVVDVTTEGPDDAPTPLRVYVNDGPGYEQGMAGRPLPRGRNGK